MTPGGGFLERDVAEVLCIGLVPASGPVFAAAAASTATAAGARGKRREGPEHLALVFFCPQRVYQASTRSACGEKPLKLVLGREVF